MARYILTPDTDPAGTSVWRGFPHQRGYISQWDGDIATITITPGHTVIGQDGWSVLSCDECRSNVLDEYACPNDTRTCVDCCPCHREDDDIDAAPIELYTCDECEAQVATATYVKDCGTCGGIGTVYADSALLPDNVDMQTACCSANVTVTLSTYVHGTPAVTCPDCHGVDAVDFAHAWRHGDWSPATLVVLRTAFPIHPAHR